MPLLSTPRIAVAFKVIPVPGMKEPTGANTPFRPARAFGAPHTTCRRSPPISTTQTRNLSAFGCGLASMTLPTTKSRKRGPVDHRFDLEADHRQLLGDLGRRGV